MNTCPCGRPVGFERCCGAIHRGDQVAITAEDLMRSRYTAFAVGDADYLRRSWDPDRRPSEVGLTRDRWIGLTIHGSSKGGAFDAYGTVHFSARYSHDGEPGEHSENSEFRRVDGSWVYVGPVAANPT